MQADPLSGSAVEPSHNASSQHGSHEAGKTKRRKSLSQSIRARLSRQSSRDSHRSSSTATLGSEPPVPSIPRSYSSEGSLESASGTSPAEPLTGGTNTAMSKVDLEAAWCGIHPPAFPTPLQYTACYCEENVYLLVQYLSSQLAPINDAAINLARKQSSSDASPSPTPGSASIPQLVPVWDVHAIFISNPNKSVLLYQQNASKLALANSPVIWDYHVIAAVTCHLVPLHSLSLCADGSIERPACFDAEVEWSRTWVYDADSRLSCLGSGELRPVRMGTYNAQTFDAGLTPAQFEPHFRVVPAKHLLEGFASDRSHMYTTTDGEKVWNAPPPTWPLIAGAQARRQGVSNNLMEMYVNMADREGEGFGSVWNADGWLKRSSVPAQTKLGATLGAGERMGVKSLDDAGIDAGKSQMEEDDSKAEARPNGGRITSHLFPAYLNASQQHRIPPPS